MVPVNERRSGTPKEEVAPMRTSRLWLFVVALVVGLSVAGAAAADGGDAAGPQVVLDTPADGAGFYQEQSVQAAYACLPGTLGSPVISCAGDLPLGTPLDTSSVGMHTFTVRAEDYAGAVTTVTHSYTVFDVISPRITIAAPADQATYEFGADVTVDYGCDDGAGGSGVEACIGTLPERSPLPTDHLGTFRFTVSAFDKAGNSATAQVTYQVVDRKPPSISISQPAAPVGDRLPVYTVGQIVSADYSCSDGSGSGVVACAGDVPAGSPLNTSTVGTHAFTVVATDAAHNSTTATRAYQVVYAFDGFASPLVPLPTFASAKSGDPLPVKFSLHGNFGLGAVVGVSSQPVDCTSAAALDAPSAALGTLGYSSGPDRYAFQWTTDRSWLGSCRQLAVFLNDGTAHRANVRFGR
jgi:hypothetical protein